MQNEDICSYLRGCFFTQEFFHRTFFGQRYVTYRAYREHVFRLTELLVMLFPARLVPQKRHLLKKYHAFVKQKSEEELRKYAREGEPLTLFGHAFFDANHHESAILLHEIITLDQYRARKLVPSHGVILDAGANLGVFALFAAHIAPQSTIYAFEPAKKTFQLLQKNIAPHLSITGINSGLGDTVTEKRMLVSNDSTVCNMVEDSPLYHGDSPSAQEVFEHINITTIDAFVAERALAHVDMIKIDTEGYEAHILRGATKTIQQHKPTIVMSAYHNKEDAAALPQLLQNISPHYTCTLYTAFEAVLVCTATS